MRTREGNKEKEIFEAAIKVFAEQGYFKATISHIASAAGLATGTVYLYFGKKESILLKIFEQVWGELFRQIERLHDRADLDSREKFETIIDALFDYFTSNPSLALVFVNEQQHLIRKDAEHFTRFYNKTMVLSETLMQEGISDGVFNPYIDAPVFSAFFFGGLRHLLHQWAENRPGFSLGEIRQTMKLVVFHGIGTSADEHQA
jgi:TetR/AcrR family fatty acid metabolism transcriptional regulator